MLKRVLITGGTFLALSVIACGAGSLPLGPSPTETPTPRPLYSFDFEGACVGQGVGHAKPYYPDDGVNKVIIFVRDSENDPYVERTTFVDTFPSEEWLPVFEQYEAAELVACLTVTKRELVERCEYTSDNDNTVSYVETYNSTYEVVLHEATTGKEVDRAELYGPSDGCPSFWLFTGDETDVSDGEPAADLIEFLQPYVEPNG